MKKKIEEKDQEIQESEEVVFLDSPEDDPNSQEAEGVIVFDRPEDPQEAELDKLKREVEVVISTTRPRPPKVKSPIVTTRDKRVNEIVEEMQRRNRR